VEHCTVPRIVATDVAGLMVTDVIRFSMMLPLEVAASAARAVIGVMASSANSNVMSGTSVVILSVFMMFFLITRGTASD
jgi:hypothetical protein